MNKSKIFFSLFLLIMNIDKLFSWYKENARNLPWRNTKDPYKIWVSEIILQQTRVSQGLDYYHHFIRLFPDLKSLANADENKVLKAWEGLGYYSRARNMHHTAKEIMENHNGNFPSEYKDLLRLKGIGPYTAAAIASFAFNKKVAAIDSNVLRFLARYYGLNNNIARASEIKIFRKKAEKIIDRKNPGLFNQAMMEFGAIQCIPVSPDCNNCIFQSQCNAYLTGNINKLPVKIKNNKTKKRHLHYFLIKKNKKFMIEKRIGKDIWKNLYQLPLLETKTSKINKKEINKFIDRYKLRKIKSIKKLNSLTHLLSHQKLYINFWELETCKSKGHFISQKETDSYPFPIIIAKFLDNYFN